MFIHSSYQYGSPASTPDHLIAEALRALAGPDDAAAAAAAQTDCGTWNHVRDALAAARAQDGQRAAQRALATLQRQYPDLIALLASAQESDLDDDDHEPASDSDAPPPLPLGGLPGWVREMVRCTAEAVQVPIDLAHALALGALSVATAGAMRVQLTPDWSEETCLYVMPALPSGERKSAAFALLIGPVEQWEDDERNRHTTEYAASQARKRVLEKEIERLTADAAKEQDANKKKQLEWELATAITEHGRVALAAPFRRLLQNATPEALTSALVAHQRIAVVSPEPDSMQVLIGAGRDGPPMLEAILKGYNGERLIIDRQTRQSQRVAAPALTMVLAAQPHAVRDLIRNRALIERGVLARYLMLLPPSRLGSRAIAPPPIPEHVKAAYAVRLRWLLDTCQPSSPEQRHTVTLSAEAWRAVQRLQLDIEPRLREGCGDLASHPLLRAWAGKLAGHVVRIAANLHAAHCAVRNALPWAEPISGEVMRAAVAYSEPLIAHMRAVLGDAVMSDTERVASRLRAIIAKHAVNGQITERTIYRAMRPETREMIERAIQMLLKDGDLEGPVNVVGRKGGRPSKVYHVLDTHAASATDMPPGASYAPPPASAEPEPEPAPPPASAEPEPEPAPPPASAAPEPEPAPPVSPAPPPASAAGPASGRVISMTPAPPAWYDVVNPLKQRLPATLSAKLGGPTGQPIGILIRRNDRPAGRSDATLYVAPFDLPEGASRDEAIAAGVQHVLAEIRRHWPDALPASGDECAAGEDVPPVPPGVKPSAWRSVNWRYITQLAAKRATDWERGIRTHAIVRGIPPDTLLAAAQALAGDT